LFGPFQNGTGLNLQVVRGLRCGEPFAFHVENSIPDASPHPRVLNSALNAAKYFPYAKMPKIEN
jgi:hypothetical protein